MNQKQLLLKIIQDKDQMQKQLLKLTIQIQSINSAKDYQKGVVDSEGFPRNDLDFGELSNYRNLKRRKAELNNDHVKLMKQIQKQMFAYHQTLPKVQKAQQQIISEPNFSKNKIIDVQKQQVHQQKTMKQEQIIKQQKYVIDYLTPFAKITLIQQNSPAFNGGIRLNDLLSEFAQVNIYTPDNIKQIPYHVKQNLELKIVLMRMMQSEEQKAKYQKVFLLKDKKYYAKVQLKITPQKWHGKGLLGCKIDPL